MADELSNVDGTAVRRENDGGLPAVPDEHPEEVPEEHPDGAEHPYAVLSLAVRAGSFILDVTKVAQDGPSFYRALVESLNEDNRVLKAVSVVDDADIPPADSINSWPRQTMYRTSFDSEVWRDRKGIDKAAFTAMSLPPIELSVYVPKKNQPARYGVASVPSEYYTAVWDGMTLLAGWERDGGDHIHTSAGGHVVGEILREAAQRLNADVYAQACTFTCVNQFSHTIMLVDVVAHEPEGIKFSNLCYGRNLHVIVQSFPGEDTIDKHMRSLLGELWRQYRHFTEMKNLAAHATILSSEASTSARRLLTLQTQRAEASEGRMVDRVKKRWQLRGWRRQTRTLIARLWLQIGVILETRRTWFQSRDAFEMQFSVLKSERLFEQDYRAEASDLERLDISTLQSQAQHAAERLDNRDVVVATGFGALAGAIAGALTSLVG